MKKKKEISVPNVTEKIKGYIVMNENKEVCYVEKTEIVEMAISRKMKGEYFKILDIEKFPADEIIYLRKL